MHDPEKSDSGIVATKPGLLAGRVDVNAKEQGAKRIAFQFQNAPCGVVDAVKLAKLGPLPDFIIACAELPHDQRFAGRTRGYRQAMNCISASMRSFTAAAMRASSCRSSWSGALATFTFIYWMLRR